MKKAYKVGVHRVDGNEYLQTNVGKPVLEHLGVEPEDMIVFESVGDAFLMYPKGSDVDLAEPQTATEEPETDGKRYELPAEVNVPMSEFEARVAGHRLWEIAGNYEEDGHEHVAQECKILARKLHSLCRTRNGNEEQEDEA